MIKIPLCILELQLKMLGIFYYEDSEAQCYFGLVLVKLSTLQGSQRAWEILENAWIWNKNFKVLESAWKQIRCLKILENYYYYYNHLTAFFPGLPGWAGTRKVKPIWILLEQETVSGSGISWAIGKSAPRSRQTTTPAPHHSVFYRPDALPATQPTASKHWRHRFQILEKSLNFSLANVQILLLSLQY